MRHGKGIFDFSSSEDEEPAELLPPRKVRKMDQFLETLQKKQAKRDAGEPDIDAVLCSTSDLTSTNLVLKPLAQEVDEHVLLAEFGRFGPIGSIKIIWPRHGEQHRPGNTGFVAFMRRSDAERAMKEMGCIEFHGHMLSVCFGDPIDLPSIPLNDGLTMSRLANPASTRERLEDGPALKVVMRGIGPDIQVSLPDDARRRYIIDVTAVYVARDGAEFEDAIKDKEGCNPDFSFLFDEASSEHKYYKWRVWSLCNGDTLTSWRVEPFLMSKDRSLWIPPPTGVVPVRDAGPLAPLENRPAPGEKTLDDASRSHLLDLLANLSFDRRSIAAAMICVIENAESCREVSQILMDSMMALNDGTTCPTTGDVQKKLCLLYLVSDVLHNTTAHVPNASQYRPVLQEVLPRLFASIESYSAAGSRLTKAGVVQKLQELVSVWREWHVIEDEVLDSLVPDETRQDPEGGCRRPIL
jgi:U2-associated protein SR140